MKEDFGVGLVTTKGTLVFYFSVVYSWSKIVRRLKLAWKHGKETTLFGGGKTYWTSSKKEIK